MNADKIMAMTNDELDCAVAMEHGCHQAYSVVNDHVATTETNCLRLWRVRK